MAARRMLFATWSVEKTRIGAKLFGRIVAPIVRPWEGPRGRGASVDGMWFTARTGPRPSRGRGGGPAPNRPRPHRVGGRRALEPLAHRRPGRVLEREPRRRRRGDEDPGQH